MVELFFYQNFKNNQTQIDLKNSNNILVRQITMVTLSSNVSWSNIFLIYS